MNFKLSLMMAFLALFSFTNLNAQKKAQSFTVTKVINAPIDEVWAVVGEDYGAIANSHPAIVNSDYINGSLKAGEGAERVCNFNDSGTRYLHEKQINYNPESYTFKNQVFQAGKFPVDPDYTYAIYKLEAVDAQTTKFTFDMNYRTSPAFMGGMMKGKFKRLIEDYAIAIEHHVKTGEAVNKDNFKSIKKQQSTR
ncbi:MAG: SRPBCC family protein [Chitinophagales bacterium]|nr:SRPBCC family protein [Chitinophagales bacterium]